MPTATFSGNIFSASTSLGIGWQADMMEPGWFNGLIDAVRVSSMARGGFSDPAVLAEDFNGNLTSDGDRQYKFDALNRVAQVARVTDGALLAEFAYDGLNRRVLKKVGANIGPVPWPQQLPPLATIRSHDRLDHLLDPRTKQPWPLGIRTHVLTSDRDLLGQNRQPAANPVNECVAANHGLSRWCTEDRRVIAPDIIL